MLTIASSVADGTRVLKEPPYFATAVHDKQIDCCASRTPHHVILVTNGTPRGLAALAADAFSALGRLPGVTGPRQAAADFSEAWLALAGGRGQPGQWRAAWHDLSLRPAIVEDAPIVPVAWICGFAATPEKMTVMAANKTDLPKKLVAGQLPVKALRGAKSFARNTQCRTQCTALGAITVSDVALDETRDQSGSVSRRAT